MSQAFIFRKNCWIYTKKSERDNMKDVINVTKKWKSVCMTHYIKYLNKSSHAVRNAVNYLVCGKVLDVQQRNEVRVYKLNSKWESNLKKCLTPPLKKKKYNSYPYIKK